MVLFLFGTNTFLAKRKLNEIIEKYRSKYRSGLNLFEIEANEEGFEKLKDFSKTISMFKEKKLIILKNLFLAKNDLQKKIYEFLKEKNIFKDEIINLIIFEESLPNKKSKIFQNFLKESFKKQEFSELNNFQVKNFIQKEIRKTNTKIENEAIEKLIFYCGNDLWKIENELQKLASFRAGEVIKKEDVENLCISNVDVNIFEIIEAVAKKEKQKALNLILKYIKGGEDEMKILSMINYQFRCLIKIKGLLEEGKNFYQIQKISKIHPFVIKKNFLLAKNFSINELKRIYKNILEIDFLIKSGKVEPQTGIEIFLMKI